VRSRAEHGGSWSGTNGFRLMPSDPFYEATMKADVSSSAGALSPRSRTRGRTRRTGHRTGSWSSGRVRSSLPWLRSGPTRGTRAAGPGSSRARWNGRRFGVGYEYAPGWQWQITIDATSADALVLQTDNVVPTSAVPEGSGRPAPTRRRSPTCGARRSRR